MATGPSADVSKHLLFGTEPTRQKKRCRFPCGGGWIPPGRFQPQRKNNLYQKTKNTVKNKHTKKRVAFKNPGFGTKNNLKTKSREFPLPRSVFFVFLLAENSFYTFSKKSTNKINKSKITFQNYINNWFPLIQNNPKNKINQRWLLKII